MNRGMNGESAPDQGKKQQNKPSSIWRAPWNAPKDQRAQKPAQNGNTAAQSTVEPATQRTSQPHAPLTSSSTLDAVTCSRCGVMTERSRTYAPKAPCCQQHLVCLACWSAAGGGEPRFCGLGALTCLVDAHGGTGGGALPPAAGSVDPSAPAPRTGSAASATSTDSSTRVKGTKKKGKKKREDPLSQRELDVYSQMIADFMAKQPRPGGDSNARTVSAIETEGNSSTPMVEQVVENLPPAQAGKAIRDSDLPPSAANVSARPPSPPVPASVSEARAKFEPQREGSSPAEANAAKKPGKTAPSTRTSLPVQEEEEDFSMDSMRKKFGASRGSGNASDHSDEKRNLLARVAPACPESTAKGSTPEQRLEKEGSVGSHPTPQSTKDDQEHGERAKMKRDSFLEQIKRNDDVTDASEAASPTKAASQQTSPDRRASFTPSPPSPPPPPPPTTVPPMAPLPPNHHPLPPVPPHPSSPPPVPSTPSATAQTEASTSVKRSAVQPAQKMMAPSAPPPPPPAPPPPSPPRVPPTSRAYRGDSLPGVDTERAASSASPTGTTARTEANTSAERSAVQPAPKPFFVAPSGPPPPSPPVRSPLPDEKESSVAEEEMMQERVRLQEQLKMMGPKSKDLATPFLGSGVLQFELMLAIDGTAIGAGSHRRSFESALANDLANSSNVAENNFRVISMVGDLVVNVEAQLMIQEGVYLDGMQLAWILERQYGDSTSRFRNGVVTKHTQGIRFPFDLGSGVVGFKHKLEIPFSDAGTEGSAERLEFQNKYLFDLCNASGVEATRFHIKNCAPGSIIIETEIHPDASGRGPLARNVFANLDKQAMDPESQLRVGVVTCSTKAEVQVGRSGQQPGSPGPTPIQMPHVSQNAASPPQPKAPETSRAARRFSRYEAALTVISQIFRRPDGGGDSKSAQQFVVQAEVGFATEGAGRLVLPSSAGKGQIRPVSILQPSQCFYCGALPGSTGKKGRQLRFRRCAACKSIDYCSERCQRKHWKETHKAECSRLQCARAHEAKNAPDYQHNQVGYEFVPCVVHSSANARPHIYHIATSDSSSMRTPSMPATPVFNATQRNERDQDLNMLQRVRDLNTPPPRARNPEIPIEQLRRDSSPPIANPPTQVGGDHAPALPAGWEQQMSASKGKAYYVHTETGRTTWVHPAKEIVDNRAYRPSHASMQEGSSNFVSDRESVYKSYASQGRPSPALSGPTQESAWSDMKRMWAEGDWRSQLPVNFGKQARQMVMTEFQDEAQSKAAHQLVGKIDDHELEVQINAEILNHGFDLNAWLCLKQARYAIINSYSELEVLMDTKNTESDGPFSSVQQPDDVASYRQDSMVHSQKRGLRLDLVSVDLLPFANGRRIKCRIRLLSPGREPLELHTFLGQTMNGELKMARRAPFDILVSDCDFDSAEIEHTLWDAEAGECENGFLGGCAILASRMAPYKRDLQGNLSILYVKYADITNGLHDPFIHGRLSEGKMRILVQHSVRPSSMGTDEQTPSHALHQHQANDSIVDHKLERRWGGEGNDVWHHNQRHHNQKAFGAAPLPQNAYAAAPPGYLYESLLAGSLSPLAPAVASSIAARGAYQALSRAGSTATLPNASATHRQHQYARDGDRHDHSGYEAADDSIKSSRSGTGMHSARSGTGHRNSPRWLMYM